MTRLTPQDHLIGNLRGQFPPNSYFYFSKERAYRQLKHVTNQDFGYDADAWEAWFDTAENPYPNAGMPYVENEDEKDS
jgi:hypothetical protein